MSNRNLWLTSWVCIAMGFAIQALLCSPTAGAAPLEQAQPSSSLTSSLQISAILPSADHSTVPREKWSNDTSLRHRMDEARAVLEDLRSFADTAQRAIQMGKKIRELRLENERLKQVIASSGKGDHEQERHLVGIGAENNRLTKTIVSNWILALELEHQASVDDDRLNLANVALVTSKARLATLKMRVKEHRSAVHDLRAKSATLAAEIGRMRRQIILSDQEARQNEASQLAIESAMRQLRHAVSARLRTLLHEH